MVKTVAERRSDLGDNDDFSNISVKLHTDIEIACRSLGFVDW